MAGRAGRPGFDTEGKVIILTQEQNVHKYRNMLSQTFTLESRLPGNLTEHLNSGGHASELGMLLGNDVRWKRQEEFTFI